MYHNIAVMKNCKLFSQYMQENDALNEGVISAAMGAMIGPKVAKAICNALGITKGPLYDMMNSNTFIRALTAYLAF